MHNNGHTASSHAVRVNMTYNNAVDFIGDLFLSSIGANHPLTPYARAEFD